jgi:hypothetical protein
METQEMGRVLTEAVIENFGDLWNVERGLLSPDKVRRVTVSDALVDTGVALPCLPARLIRQLGLMNTGHRRAIDLAGTHDAPVYAAARVTIQDRSCGVDVLEVPDDEPVVVGHIILTALDLVVAPEGGRLIGDPAHGGEWIIDLYAQVDRL